MNGFGYQAVSFSIVLLVAVVAAYCDLRWRLIPNALTYPAVFSGIMVNWLMLGSKGLTGSLLGATVGFAFFFVFFALHLIGGGDVKLMAGAGALLGIDSILPALFWTSIAGALLSVVCLLRFKGRFAMGPLRQSKGKPGGVNSVDTTSRANGRSCSVPYGVAIGIGAIVASLI